KINSST
ncbi:ATP-dependent RNA helicase DeaD, partial [Haemophilus influenzae]